MLAVLTTPKVTFFGTLWRSFDRGSISRSYHWASIEMGVQFVNPNGDFPITAHDQLIYLADHREDLERILSDIWDDV